MSRPRPPPLGLTQEPPPTPPATPNKQQHSTSPNQKTSWTPTKSVRFALPTSALQTHHKPKTSQNQTASIFNAYYHRNPKPEPKPKRKRISTKPFRASVNRLIESYYSLVQSLCDRELFGPQVADNKTITKTSGILASPSSPVVPAYNTRAVHPQIQDKQDLQALRNYAYISIYQPLTAVASLLTLPSFPSQEKEREVRKVVKQAKRGLKFLQKLKTRLRGRHNLQKAR